MSRKDILPNQEASRLIILQVMAAQHPTDGWQDQLPKGQRWKGTILERFRLVTCWSRMFKLQSADPAEGYSEYRNERLILLIENGMTRASEKSQRDWEIQALQGGALDGSLRSVPKTQRLIPALQANRTTGMPAICSPRLASREKAAFKLMPVRRVEALKKATGLGGSIRRSYRLASSCRVSWHHLTYKAVNLAIILQRCCQRQVTAGH